MRAWTNAELDQVRRLAEVAGRLHYIAQHPQSDLAERAWAQAAGAGIEDRAKSVAQFVSGVPIEPYNVRFLSMGQGGEAYLCAVEEHTAALLRALQYRTPQAMGIWSWNPVKWGMTQAEADAYDLERAKQAAAVEAANPTVLGTISNTVKDTVKSTGQVTTALMWLVGLGLVGWGVSEVVAARGEHLAVGYVRTGAAAARAAKEARS